MITGDMLDFNASSAHGSIMIALNGNIVGMTEAEFMDQATEVNGNTVVSFGWSNITFENITADQWNDFQFV